MNYWPRWIGSIQKKTSHLSLAEMGAYDRLLDHYYANEAPLPANLDRCCRISGATSKAERAAVESVLSEFFCLTDGGYTNQRAAKEITEAKPKLDAARTNGAKGGRPKKNPEKTHGVPVGNPEETESESSTTTTTKNKQEKEKARKRADPPPTCPDDVDPQVWADWLTLRQRKRATATVTVIDGARAEAGKAGMSFDAFLRVWCRRGSQGLEADWLKPDERASGAKSFRERDAEAAAARMSDIGSPRIAARPHNTFDVIDMETANALALGID